MESLADLQPLHYIRTLNLKGNNLLDIPADVFDVFNGVNSLSVVDVSSNNLTSQIFKSMRNATGLIKLNMDNNNLDQLPSVDIQFMAANLETLSLRKNSLKADDLKSLKNFTHLYELFIDNNFIEEIPTEIFQNLLNLGTISLNGNRINTITNDTFSGLSASMQNIYIKDNRIDSVESGAFTMLRGLRELDLSGNRITALTLPATMSQLLALRLARNAMTSFPNKLQSFGLLNVLDMSGNQLAVLPPLIMYNPLVILLLDFSGNQLENIDAMKYAGQIQTLNLSHNALLDIGVRIFNQSTRIDLLDISYNSFSRIPDAIINPHALASLVDVRLDYNNITAVDNFQAPVTYMKSAIERLSLRGNHLTALTPEMSVALNFSLHTLDVRDNLLFAVDEADFENMEHLVELYLAGNPILCDCSTAWIRALAQRVTVDGLDALCVSPYDLEGIAVVCYNVSGCDAIPKATRELRDPRCQNRRPSSTSTSTTVFTPTSSSILSSISNVVTVPSPKSSSVSSIVTVPSQSAGLSTDTLQLSSTSVSVNASQAPQWGSPEPSLPYSRDGLIAGLVLGGIALIVIIVALVYLIRSKRMSDVLRRSDSSVAYDTMNETRGMHANGNGIENPGFGLQTVL
jgi:Leucine-rich repeat (LRR) protein